MKKNIFAILVFGLTLSAQASGIKILGDAASKKLYSALKVTVIDADDVVEKHFTTSSLTIVCYKSVVDKSASCHVPDEKKELTGADAKKLYQALKVTKEDHDDIINKVLRLEGFSIECEYYVVDKDYSCTVQPLDL